MLEITVNTYTFYCKTYVGIKNCATNKLFKVVNKVQHDKSHGQNSGPFEVS